MFHHGDLNQILIFELFLHQKGMVSVFARLLLQSSTTIVGLTRSPGFFLVVQLSLFVIVVVGIFAVATVLVGMFFTIGLRNDKKDIGAVGFPGFANGLSFDEIVLSTEYQNGGRHVGLDLWWYLRQGQDGRQELDGLT